MQPSHFSARKVREAFSMVSETKYTSHLLRSFCRPRTGQGGYDHHKLPLCEEHGRLPALYKNVEAIRCGRVLRGAAPQSQGCQREGGQAEMFQKFVHNVE